MISKKDIDIKNILKPYVFSTQEKEIRNSQRLDFGFLFLFPALLLLFPFFTQRPSLSHFCLLALALPALTFTNPAQGFELSDLFYNNNQKAQQAIEEKNYIKAAELAEDNSLEAYAKYQNNEFKLSADILSDSTNVDDLYNSALSHIQNGDYDKGIKKLNHAKKIKEDDDINKLLDLAGRLKIVKKAKNCQNR